MEHDLNRRAVRDVSLMLSFSALAGLGIVSCGDKDVRPCEETQPIATPIYADLSEGQIPVMIHPDGKTYRAEVFDIDNGSNIFSTPPISSASLNETNDYATSFELTSRDQTLYLKINADDETVTTHC